MDAPGTNQKLGSHQVKESTPVASWVDNPASIQHVGAFLAHVGRVGVGVENSVQNPWFAPFFQLYFFWRF